MSTAATLPAREHWLELASKLKLRTQAFMDGRFVGSASGETFDDISPRDGRLIAQARDPGPRCKTTWIDLS